MRKMHQKPPIEILAWNFGIFVKKTDVCISNIKIILFLYLLLPKPLLFCVRYRVCCCFLKTYLGCEHITIVFQRLKRCLDSF
jgi:hypothetical protein